MVLLCCPTGSPPYLCSDCSQRFQFEFPFLAHQRFRCTKRLQSLNGSEEEPKDASEPTVLTPARTSPKLGRPDGFPNPPEAGKPATDFHNLARDLENNRTSPPSDKEAEISSESSAKRKFSDMEEGVGPLTISRSSGLGLPMKSKEELATSAREYRGAYGLEPESRRTFSPPGSEHLGSEGKRSAFTEVRKSPQNLKHSASNKTSGSSTSSSSSTENKESGRPGGSPSDKHPLGTRQVLGETQSRMDPPPPHLASAFTSVAQQVGAGAPERKSAFSQPARSSSSSTASSFPQLSPLVMAPKLLDCHPAVGDTVSSSRLYQADPLAAKLQGSDLGGACPVPGSLAKQSPFLYAAAAATAFWPKSAAAAAAAAAGPIQLQMPSALTLLPPSFTSLCLPAQNWCAKCNASFRMTSDLVYHMRSHHKKEFAMEPLVKRRREEKLKCPICNESFRERHHLSRHMTSHN